MTMRHRFSGTNYPAQYGGATQYTSPNTCGSGSEASDIKEPEPERRSRVIGRTEYVIGQTGVMFDIKSEIVDPCTIELKRLIVRAPGCWGAIAFNHLRVEERACSNGGMINGRARPRGPEWIFEFGNELYKTSYCSGWNLLVKFGIEEWASKATGEGVSLGLTLEYDEVIYEQP